MLTPEEQFIISILRNMTPEERIECLEEIEAEARTWDCFRETHSTFDALRWQTAYDVLPIAV